MAQYDVAHIDLIRYRELRRLVREGRAKAVITVEYLVADASSPAVLADEAEDVTLNMGKRA